MSKAAPLGPQQRRSNYVKQRGRILGPFMILTPRQYRRLAKKSKGAIQRVWVAPHKRLQAFAHPKDGPYVTVHWVNDPADPLLTRNLM